MPRLAATLSVLLLGLSLLLPACASKSPPCVDPQGCLEVPPGSPIVLAAILATEGSHAAGGNAALQGIELAIGEKSEILGHPIQLDLQSTDCSAGRARLAALQVATDEQVAVVIGPTCEEEAGAIAAILSDAGIALVTPAPGVSEAYDQAYQVFAAIQKVLIQESDKRLYVPRLGLIEALRP